MPTRPEREFPAAANRYSSSAPERASPRARHFMKSLPTASAALFVLCAGLSPPCGAEHRATSIDLPGLPAQITPVELDGDPAPELAIVVVYSTWDEIAVEETSEIDEVEGLVEVLTIVPALLDRRELWLFDHDDGKWAPLAEPLEMTTAIHTLEGWDHPASPLLALTDDGFALLEANVEGPSRQFRWRTVVEASPILAGSSTFLPELSWTHRLDDDPWPDALLPLDDGWALHRGTSEGLAPVAEATFERPLFDDVATARRSDLSLPEVRDIDGDGRADLLFPHPTHGWRRFHVARNEGSAFGARFGPMIGPLGERQPVDPDADGPRVVLFDDLDGDGRAEYVVQETHEPPDEAGMREELEAARRPRASYRVHGAGPGLRRHDEPRLAFDATGYAFAGSSDIGMSGSLTDLDGDRRRDLVTVTLDFSVLQALRIVVTRTLKIGLDFQVHCQQGNGSFQRVEGLDLSGVFRLDLRNFRQSQLSLFRGDFDGDGRRDFLQIGRGETATVHLGRDGCRFPSTPDLTIPLLAAPRDLALVAVRDLDGDGRDDLAVTQPLPREGRGESAAARLEIYLSGDERR